MAQRYPRATIFDGLTREEAVEKWAGWWTKYLADNYDGHPMYAARDIFGVTETGNVRASAQAQKWQYVHNNALPSQMHLDAIKEKTGIEDESVFINHNHPPNDPANIRQGHGKKKSNGKAADQPVFKIDNPDIPKPHLAFRSSDEFTDHYEFEMKAILPMSGVLALMALLDDAH